MKHFISSAHGLKWLCLPFNQPLQSLGMYYKTFTVVTYTAMLYASVFVAEHPQSDVPKGVLLVQALILLANVRLGGKLSLITLNTMPYNENFYASGHYDVGGKLM
jgi:hypothetical protein